MKKVWLLRLIIIGTLWLGLGILVWEGIANQEILWQAGIFTTLLLIGAVLEHLVTYKGDPYLLPTVQLLLVIGLVFITRIWPNSALKQFRWACLGLLIYYIVLYALRNYRDLGRFRYLSGLGAVALLLITLLFGVTQGGATSWISLGVVNFETEELVKVAMLIFLASYLSEHEEILRVGTVQIGPLSLPDWRTLGPFLVMGAISLLLLAAQKSLGTALVFYSLYVLVLYVVTERWIYLGVSVPIFLATGALGYTLFGHVRVRVHTWLNPWVDTVDQGYQIAQSLFAISGGKILGVGLGNGIGAIQVPAAGTDFIFSIIAEELGFAGAMAILMLFLVVVMRAFQISLQARDRFGQILAAGIGILIGTETIIILAGVTKLLPLTGIPLPWVSYGGSSLLIHFILLGLLANISHATAVGPIKLKTKGREYAA